MERNKFNIPIINDCLNYSFVDNSINHLRYDSTYFKHRYTNKIRYINYREFGIRLNRYEK